ncbi:sensor histidine kinase [Planococcus salinus]|uniref:histidine kinase n=1 Tax=Planococcus salinus TaxID=1848460 RepID=A0A3M8P779_9BACL|nr:HAMP domain-containing sensor histidine kinase [Planococcus salinus]RNF39472.1 two-component sensor histidine kinase [Planococcus salinus]
MFEMMTGMINNIFFIIFPIILYQMFAATGKRNFFVSHRVMLTILFSISIILCMIFPYQFMTDDYIFDLRQVPMIVGALYGGPLVSAVLFLVSAIGRVFIGGDGMYIAILNQLLIAVGVPLLRPQYLRMKQLSKTLLVFGITIVSLLFNLVAGYVFFGDPIHDLIGIWLILMLNHGTIIVLTALLIEHIQRQEYLLNSLVKHEKIETVSHFAASVAHELRNPMQSIKGFVQLLQSHEYNRDKQVEFHDIILKELNDAESLIDDYLVFAKPTYGQLESVMVDEEISQVIKVTKPYASWQNVELQLLHTCEKCRVVADRQKFHQALVNIIRNGIEAMTTGGTLSIGVSNMQSSILIEIKDEGLGMTKEQVQRLGEPYFSTKTKGTGLGMMVVYSIIHQMNGTIEVDSEKGKGTIFKLYLPAADSLEEG